MVVPIIGSMAIKGIFKAGAMLAGLGKTVTGLKQVEQRSKSTSTEVKRMTGQTHLLSKAMAAIGVAGFSALLMTTPQLAGSLAKIKIEMMRIAWALGKHLKPLLDAVGTMLRAIRTGDWELFKSAARDAWNALKTMATGAYTFLKDKVYPRLVSFWNEEVKPAIVSAFTSAWGWIKGLLPQWVIDIANWTYNMGVAIKNGDWQGIWDAVVEPLEWAWNKFKDTKLGGMITGFLEKIKEYSEPIKEAIETLIEWKAVGKEIWKGIWAGILEGAGFGSGDTTSHQVLAPRPGVSSHITVRERPTPLGEGQTGLHVPRTGLYKLHEGETVTMRGSTPPGSGESGPTNITLDFSGANISLASGIELEQFADTISNRIAEKQHRLSY